MAEQKDQSRCKYINTVQTADQQRSREHQRAQNTCVLYMNECSELVGEHRTVYVYNTVFTAVS